MMSNQNRFLLPHTSASTSNTNLPHNACDINSSTDQENNQLSVDVDFDSYWEEEARNPHRNRIRIGRQYQATVPPLLKHVEEDQRKLDELETLSFCPKKSAKVSNAELDHYFTVAKSLNLFASLVETRSLLGRDVTIADLNHIRHKEGLSLASVIQPRHSTSYNNSSNPSNSSQQQQLLTAATSSSAIQQSPQKSPSSNADSRSTTSTTSHREMLTSNENYTFNQPLMRALSHFISLHHPCHHDTNCKKLLKDVPPQEESESVSIPAGNLRQGPSSVNKDVKPGRSRSSVKQNSTNLKAENSEAMIKDAESENQSSSDNQVQSPSYQDWTREEVELFSKAIEVCGKNFGSIKKEFLPSKSVRSIVEYYYIGSRDISEHKKKCTQLIEPNEEANIVDKPSSTNSQFKNTSDNISSTSNKLDLNRTSSASSSGGPNVGARTSSNKISSRSANNTDNPSNFGQSQLVEDSLANQSKSKNFDARMSIYNFDDDIKEDSPTQIDCPVRPGAEVKPLKAKPILPNASSDAEAGNSNLGSLKFFMDGQLVLKLNACQEQQEGIDKCHWVQSGEKAATSGRHKRYTKKSNDRSMDLAQNGSQSNSVVSSNQDDDSKTGDLSPDEDSKESASSFSNLRQKSQSTSPNSKRLRAKNDSSSPQQSQQLPSPIDYNRVAVNNRMKERNDSLNQASIVNQAAAMPWLQANSFAVAAALLGRLPQFHTTPAPNTGDFINNSDLSNSSNVLNMTSKPMDLSVEHNPSPKPIQSKSSSRSKSRPKNNT